MPKKRYLRNQFYFDTPHELFDVQPLSANTKAKLEKEENKNSDLVYYGTRLVSKKTLGKNIKPINRGYNL